MSKNTKNIALIIVAVFIFVMVYNILSSTNNSNVYPRSMSQAEETPFYVSLLLSWFPFMISIVFYILYYKCLKQIIHIGERIAVALETKPDNMHSQNSE